MAVEGREFNIEEYEPPGWPEDFPQRLERLLEMADLTRGDLARFLGVTERTVQKWLTGGGRPKGGSYYGIVQLSRAVPGGFELMLYGKAGADGEAKK